MYVLILIIDAKGWGEVVICPPPSPPRPPTSPRKINLNPETPCSFETMIITLGPEGDGGLPEHINTSYHRGVLVYHQTPSS